MDRSVTPTARRAGRRRLCRLAAFAAALCALAVAVPLASAVGVAPAVSAGVSGENGFPLWYQDALGQRVEACLDPADAQCVLPAAGEEPNFDPAAPVRFPQNFPGEFFYSVADSDIIQTDGCGGETAPGKAHIRLAVEGSFTTGEPVVNQQIVFTRTRVIVTSGLCPDTTYQFTYPYGTKTFTTNEAGAVPANAGTTDVGCLGAPCDFASALAGDAFQGFLHWESGAPAGYLGDAGVLHTVVGGTNGNSFSITRDGDAAPLASTDLWTVSGKTAGPLLASPESLDLGGVEAGTTSSAKAVRLTSIAAQPLALQSISVAGANAGLYSVDASDCTDAVSGALRSLATDESCNVLVNFTPPVDALGRLPATLVVAHDGVRSPFSVALTGNATAPGATAALTLDAPNIDFGVTRIPTTSPISELTVTNTAPADATGAPLAVSGVQISGTNAAEFAVARDTCTGNFVDPGQSCVLDVTFKPAGRGDRSATLTIASNDPAGAATVALAGQAVGGDAAVSTERKAAEGNFPTWFQDDANVRLAPCVDGTNPRCVLPAAGEEPDWDPSKPVSFPGTPDNPLNFPTEFFYGVADSDIVTTPGCQGSPSGRAFIRLALEGAFAGAAPVDGEQIAFGRVRVSVTSGLCPNHQYLFVNPYGVERFTADAAGGVRRAAATEDIGCLATLPCTFADALQSRILSGFLRWDGSAPKAPAGYVGDAVTLHKVTGGSYVRDGAPVNYFAILDADDQSLVGRTNLWTVAGKLAGPIVTAPTSHDFGPVFVGETSQTQEVTLTNSESADVTIEQDPALSNAADFSLVDTPGGTTACAAGTVLGAGESCAVDVAFAPTTTGTLGTVLTIPHTGLNSPSQIQLTGTGKLAGVPAITLTPSTLAFTDERVGGTTATQTVTVSSDGTAPLTLTSVGSSSSDFVVTDNTCPSDGTTVLDAGATCTLAVAFAPQAGGDRTGTIDVVSDAANAPTASVHLTGFGFDGGAAVSATVDAADGFPLWYQDANGVRLQACLDVTDPNCVVLGDAGFDPAQPLHFPSNFPGEFFYSLADSDIVATPGCRNQFGASAPGTAFMRIALEGTFANDAPIAGDQMTFGRLRFFATGLCPNTRYVFTYPYGTQEFTANSAGSVPRNAGTTDVGCNPAAPLLCDFSLATGSELLQQGFLRWDPAVAPVAPQGYLGDAATPHRVVGSPLGTNLFGIAQANPDGSTTPVGETRLFTVSGKLAPALMAAPTQLAFANQALSTSSAPQVVTVTNTARTPVTLGAPQAAGAFSIVAASTTCSAGRVLTHDQSCAIAVVFTPTAAGPTSGTLTVPDQAGLATASVALSGIGAVPAVSVAPARLDLGAAAVGSDAAPASVVVTNTGTAPLVVASLRTTGDFRVVAQTCSAAPVAAGASCTVDVGFRPTVPGARTGTLVLVDNALDSPQSVALSGVGAVAAVTLNPASIAFADQRVGTTSANRTVLVQSSGSAPLTVSGVGLTGADFVLVANGCTGAVLQPGASCAVTVAFDPTAAGARTGTITVADNADTGTQTVALSGRGVGSAIGLSPTALAFGTVGVRGSSSKTLKVTNTGTADLNFTDPFTIGGANAGQFSITASGTSCRVGTVVRPGASCNINVTFRPTTAGAKAATLTLRSDAGAPRAVPLSGTGR